MKDSQEPATPSRRVIARGLVSFGTALCIILAVTSTGTVEVVSLALVTLGLVALVAIAITGVGQAR